MGIGIDVNGLVNVSKGERTSIAKAGWNFVADICKAMGWQEIPWKEPAGEGGLATSRNYTTLSLFLKVVDAAEFAISPLREGEVTRSENQYLNFPQIADRDIYWNIYAPFDIPGPVVHGDSPSYTTFSVGSVVRYGQELAKLAPYLNQEFVRQAFQSEEIEATRILDRVTDIFEMFQIGVVDSLRLKLPLVISW